MSIASPAAAGSQDEVSLASRPAGAGLLQTEIAVPDMHCGACMRRVETALQALPQVVSARANLSGKRVSVTWRRDGGTPAFIATLGNAGYAAHLSDLPEDDAGDLGLQAMIRAMAVAAFCAANIMLLSVSVWAGAEPELRLRFHILSGLIALPALVYSGRIFFASALKALRHGRTNMDVPISIGVILAFALSIYETSINGPHAYFDAAVSLLFFLLIGRCLDHMMRERARRAVSGLARLAARGAHVLGPDGARRYLPIGDIGPGMVLALAKGERAPVDGRILEGSSDFDTSLATGESLPVAVTPGATVQAGTINLTAPVTMVATASAANSLIAEMIRLMEAAEGGRSGYRRIADRAARLYAPMVHLLALFTFIGWMIAGAGIHASLTTAIAVLIITCPCALGLAVPMVQVVAARRLFEQGILIKDGAALERLSEIDTVVFDKTGTLTQGTPRLEGAATLDPDLLAIAASMAVHSLHPYSKAISAESKAAALPAEAVQEFSGMGLEARIDGRLYRLGRPAWALRGENTEAFADFNVVLAADGVALAGYRFSDRLRRGTMATIAALQARRIAVEVLSGDRTATVAATAAKLGISFTAEASPADKVARLKALRAAGRRVLMVGDGLNDAAAMVEAHASMAPASAADIGRNAADMIFMHDDLEAVATAHAVAVSAHRLIRQNFALAIGYNAIAVPVAILGLLTPLLASIAMSSSSVIVSANAMRLSPPRRTRTRIVPQPRPHASGEAQMEARSEPRTEKPA